MTGGKNINLAGKSVNKIQNSPLWDSDVMIPQLRMFDEKRSKWLKTHAASEAGAHLPLARAPAPRSRLCGDQVASAGKIPRLYDDRIDTPV